MIRVGKTAPAREQMAYAYYCRNGKERVSNAVCRSSKNYFTTETQSSADSSLTFFGAIDLVLLIPLFSTCEQMSSRFNAGELSRVASMLQSKYGKVTIDEQFKNSQRFQLVRINDDGSEGSQQFDTKLFV